MQQCAADAPIYTRTGNKTQRNNEESFFRFLLVVLFFGYLFFPWNMLVFHRANNTFSGDLLLFCSISEAKVKEKQANTPRSSCQMFISVALRLMWKSLALKGKSATSASSEIFLTQQMLQSSLPMGWSSAICDLDSSENSPLSFNKHASKLLRYTDLIYFYLPHN